VRKINFSTVAFYSCWSESPDYANPVVIALDDLRKLLKVARAAEKVCYYDWSDNDGDAVKDVETLRARYKALNARQRARK
jgi:hypothetical protein